MPERLSRLRNTGAVLSLAAILVACGDNGEDKTTRGKTDTNYESAEQTTQPPKN